MVSGFCSRNKIEYLTYHAPIFVNGENICDEKWGGIILDSIMQNIEEAKEVIDDPGLQTMQ